MQDIKCPHCHKAFKVDEAGFADILKQVRDSQFDKEIHQRLEMAEKEKRQEIELAEEKLKSVLRAELNRKEQEVEQLKVSQDRLLSETVNKKEAEMAELKAKLERANTEKELSVTQAVNAIEKQRDQLSSELKSKETE